MLLDVVCTWATAADCVVHLATLRYAGSPTIVLHIADAIFSNLEDLTMRFKLVPLILAVSCFPAVAQINSPHLTQGSISALRGRAHIIEGAGTYIEIEMPNATRRVVGYIPFGDEPTFPQLSRAEGHVVEVSGVVGLDGGAMITMTDTTQLTILD